MRFTRLCFGSVSGLSKRTTTEKLQEAFSQFGEVVHGLFSCLLLVLNFCNYYQTYHSLVAITARVVTDRVSGYSKGFGFVRYATLEDAAKGIEGMDGKVS